MNINITEGITSARSGSGRNGAVIFEYFAVASKKLVKTYGLFFKIRNEGAIIQKGGGVVWVFFYY